MLRRRAFTIHCRGFRAPRSALARPSRSSRSPGRREMAGKGSPDGSPWNRESPRTRDGVHAAKASVHHNVKASPLVFSKSRKEQSRMVLGTADSPVGAACSTDIGNPELCGSGPFDICMPQRVGHIKLNRSLLERNREERRENERAKMGLQHKKLQPGMVLLKNYLKRKDQVDIITRCRTLGVGSGGFYQPGYRDGAKLSLQMMCLGKNWDPQRRSYGDIRPTDGAKAPQIPLQFIKLVEEAIQTAHSLIEQDVGGCCSVQEVLPNILPDLCIVNFYSKNGKLGLHQDRDESRESLDKGLPVVSFSLGDTADFLYGESRDVDKAEIVELESGDVLIFGGKSRHIFHGVSSIHPGTAPKWLVEETNLRPGRLNLTFRQF